MNTTKHEYSTRLFISGWVVLTLLLLTHVASASERDADAAKLAAQGKSPETQPETQPRGYLDFTKGDRIPPRKGGPTTWSMGPTGIIGVKNHGGGQVRILAVMPGSPADGKVLPGDVLLGVQGHKFKRGQHIDRLVGNEIIKAETEAGKGILKIAIWRDRNWGEHQKGKDMLAADLEKMFRDAEKGGNDLYEWKDAEARTAEVKKMVKEDAVPVDGVYSNVTLQLEVMGSYSETSPWDCPVVQKVRDNALKFIAKRFEPDERGRIRGSWPDVLALVASGKPEYVKLAKQWVHSQELCQDIDATVTLADVSGGYNSWRHGFNPLEMAIYHEATGDDFVLPEIRKRAILVALGQNGGGSWGHNFAFPGFNGGLLHQTNPGYGALNNAGTRCFFLLAMAKKAGIKHPEINAAILRSSRFFRTFVDKGCVPYGYHPPANSDDSNGKNYGAAYAFHSLGMKYEAKYFSIHSAHAAFTRRGGHGSPTLWYYTPLSAHLAGPRAIKAYMRNMRHFYTLSRRHDGSFIFLGGQWPGIGGKGMRNATATVAMHLSAPLKQLVITGKNSEDTWINDEEYEELLLSARGMEMPDGKSLRVQITDPALLKQVGTPWNLRGTDELIALLDHFYPQMRGRIGAELAKRYKAGEKDIVAKVLPLLKNDEARMRDGACKTLSACGTDVVLGHLSKVVAMLKDDAEFVRMQAAQTMGAATQPGDKKREEDLLKAAVDDYAGMTMDNGNVRNAVKNLILARRGDRGQLGSDPFGTEHSEDLLRSALEKIVTMDPQGAVPGGWNREALLKLAGPIVFAAENRQLNDAMFGDARQHQAIALLRKHGYQDAVDADAANLRKRSKLERGERRRVSFRIARDRGQSHSDEPYVRWGPFTQGSGAYRDYLDDFRLWLQDKPARVFKNGTPLWKYVRAIELDPDTRLLPNIGPDVAKMFQSELASAGDAAAQLALCRKELSDLDRKNFFRKMEAMSHLAKTLGSKSIDDVCPFLGHAHWRVSAHAEKLSVDLMKQGAGPRLIKLYDEAQARESGLQGNVNAAGILDAMARARYQPALSVVRAALKHHDPLVRKSAVQAVFAIGGDRELKTVFAFMRSAAKEPEDFHGVELALLSKRDNPAHVQSVSKQAIDLLPGSGPALRRSLAWLLGQFGGKENLAAIEQAAATTEDGDDLRAMVEALAYSPDRATSTSMVTLVKKSKAHCDAVAQLAVHRMVGAHGVTDVTDRERVWFARKILFMKYDGDLIKFLGWVYTADSMQLLFDVMKRGGSAGRYVTATELATQAIIDCSEGMKQPSIEQRELATEVLTNVIEYIEVTYLRGGITSGRVKLAIYLRWQSLQVRAAKELLRFHNPEEDPIEEFEDIELND